jgi:chitin disaccharide deacetylase
MEIVERSRTRERAPVLSRRFRRENRASASAGQSQFGPARPNADCHRGLLLINADDWGLDTHTTGRILDCALQGTISSVSAMVFMQDSERAAEIARERGMDAGLHLNLTTPFSERSCPQGLRERQAEVCGYLRRNFCARAIYNPWLKRAFRYVVKAQIEEYCRIYGREPVRFDGHHHMHLCANVLLGGLLPTGTIVRRHFSWEPGEKPVRNLLFRKFTNAVLTRRHRIVDFLFSLPPLEPPARLQRIFSLASKFVVELETHPVDQAQYRFLARGEIFRWTAELPLSWDRPS